MQNLKNEFERSKVSFILTAVGAFVGLISLILYIATGVIRGYTSTLNVWMIIFLILSIAINVITLFKTIGGLNSLPFAGYLICMLIFLAHNSNYIVAVIRAIDITSVSASFVLTIVLLVAAAILGLVGLILRPKANKTEQAA